MSLSRLLVAATAGSIAGLIAVGAVSADKAPSVRAQPSTERRPAPAALSAAARAARVKVALKNAGLAAAVLANNGTRLTPIAPAHASGAAITYAGPGVLLGAAPGEPDGAFLLMHSAVKLRFPTTAPKVYVLTCRFDLFGSQPKVTIVRQGATNVSIPLENGHILHAFQANGPNATVSLEVLPPNNFPSAGYFYGCDLDT